MRKQKPARREISLSSQSGELDRDPLTSFSALASGSMSKKWLTVACATIILFTVIIRVGIPTECGVRSNAEWMGRDNGLAQLSFLFDSA